MILALPLFLQLVGSNAPFVAPSTMASFAQHESGMNPNAIYDNTTGQGYRPGTAAAAIAIAAPLLDQGHSLDLGIMQINSANMARTGLTVVTAFDPGQSIRAGGQIIAAAYEQCLHGKVAPTPAEQQAALRCTASVYNTGREQAGILNGYQAKVWRVATQLVPAIQTARAEGIEPPLSPAAAAAGADVVAPMPRRPSPGLRDTLHASPPVPDTSDELVDALHTPRPPVQSEKEAP